MAIIFYKFKTPLNISKLSSIDIGNAMLFATKKEIPAGYKVDLTPEGYKNKYTLVTKVDDKSKREDTVAEIHIEEEGDTGVVVSDFNPEGFPGKFVEREGESFKFGIDEELTTFFLCQPNTREGGNGFRIDGIVQYERRV